ncbi:MAG: pilus assembly protein PilM, partial [Thermoguttaceae bacterium]|nr:pilus assembly protein PilM [Thermoguttaceae bacterium]
MASNHIVWGIDIGNTSLKALRCTAGSEPGTMQVLGFDYIEHSKVLSQPGADAAQIMAETIAQFLSRNDIAGEKVAISVSGQNALWRFQPLPPVDPRKLKDLVKYEVRQWLPFDLDEVIWNYRQVGGFQEGNILIDANIFMYAMKKELTNKTLNQYESNGLSVDSIQGVPIALYNCYVNERYEPGELDGADLSSLNDYDVLINVGTDSTEVVITNGVSVWLRNIVLGGNAFTKALTKSLKLTFSNAEHIKRNAATSQDPKAVILAMRSVFNELYAEIDRSIKYYCSLNKRANIRKIYAFGNAMKLPGLRQFLAKSSGYEVEIPSRFKRLEGQEVLANPQFTGNLSSFSIAYGLALEQLHQATL